MPHRSGVEQWVIHKGQWQIILAAILSEVPEQAMVRMGKEMTSTKMIRALHAANQLNQTTIETLEKRIAELEEWIRYEGIIDDTCTYAILNRVCDGCRCGRLDTNAKSSQSSDEGGRGNARGMVDGSI